MVPQMEWDSRIGYTKRLKQSPILVLLSSYTIISLLSILSIVNFSLVNSFEYQCDPSSRECFCGPGPDETYWEILCPASLIETHPITLKGKPSQYFDTFLSKYIASVICTSKF